MLNSIYISVAGWGRGIISYSYLVRFLSKGGKKSLWLSKTSKLWEARAKRFPDGDEERRKC